MSSSSENMIFEKIKAISNEKRFEIISLTQDKKLSITKLSSKIKLAYNKCSDYVNLLEKLNLINKERIGKETLVSSKVKILKNKIEFN